MVPVDELEARLGYQFRNPLLLRLALTHPSLHHETGGQSPDNQRLEFLGDSVLGLALTHSLYEKFPELDEGPLTKLRAGLVNARSLAMHARRLELGRFILMSRAEEQQGGRDRSSILSDAVEAIIGALYLDGGFGIAQAFVLKLFQNESGEFEGLPGIDNPKGELQELLQAQSGEPIIYRLEATTGPDHDRSFECSIHHAGRELGRGTGKSKKAAESAAAQVALINQREKPPA